jgi:hypothetical protein
VAPDERHDADPAADPGADCATGLDEPIADIVRELAQVRETISRCAGCENFRAVVTRVRDDLDGLAAPAASAAREQLAAWLAEQPDRVKTTNHCEVCVPAGPYERFAAALRRAGRGPAR